MKIEVLGAGCSNCSRLEERVRAAADELGIPCEIEHIREIEEIVKRGVMATPALIVAGRVVASGRVPSHAELTRFLS
jgi:small redox-active disulfide protein 2